MTAAVAPLLLCCCVLAGNAPPESSESPVLSQVAVSPQIFSLTKALSAAECEELRQAATQERRFESHMGGHSSNWRVSTTSWVRKDAGGSISVVDKLVATIATFANMSVNAVRRGHPIQVVEYPAGGRYFPHFDSRHKRDLQPYSETIPYDDGFEVEGWFPHAGRVMTALCYLSDTGAGGETVFPLANKDGSSVEHAPDYDFVMGLQSRNPKALPMWEKQIGPICEGSAVNATGFRVKPEMGTCLLFYNHLATSADGKKWRDGDPLQELDPLSLHAGCPLKAGSKWIANVWIEAQVDGAPLQEQEGEEEEEEDGGAATHAEHAHSTEGSNAHMNGANLMDHIASDNDGDGGAEEFSTIPSTATFILRMIIKWHACMSILTIVCAVLGLLFKRTQELRRNRQETRRKLQESSSAVYAAGSNSLPETSDVKGGGRRKPEKGSKATRRKRAGKKQ